jgi:hypothetical protein
MSILFSHPVKKLTLLATFGGGYVLGAKAGRERYEQIKQTAQQVAEDPRVQQATAQAQEFVHETAEKVKEDPRLKDIADKVTDKVGSVAKHSADTAEDAVDKVEEAVDTAKHAASSDSPTPPPAPPTPKPTPPPAPNNSSDVHPLLADEHIELEETVVYSAGPDVEESIDELIDPKSDHA